MLIGGSRGDIVGAHQFVDSTAAAAEANATRGIHHLYPIVFGTLQFI